MGLDSLCNFELKMARLFSPVFLIQVAFFRLKAHTYVACLLFIFLQKVFIQYDANYTRN